MSSYIDGHSPLISFHLLQYEALRKEIESCIQEMRTLERYALLGTGVVWAWLATNPQSHIFWWIPLLFCILGWLRTMAVVNSVRRLAGYIREVESSFFSTETIAGWETYKLANVSRSVKLSVYTFWILLSAATIIVPLIIIYKP